MKKLNKAADYFRGLAGDWADVGRNAMAAVRSDPAGFIASSFDPRPAPGAGQAMVDFFKKPGLETFQNMVGGGAPLLGATVWHGTPHRFPATPKNPLGEFDMSKIGTGEGAQAYGHGLYLADSPEVATSYQHGLTNRDFIRKVRDIYDETVSPSEATESLLAHGGLSDSERALLHALQQDGWLGFDYPHQAVQAVLREGHNFDVSPATAGAVRDFGSLYKVALPDEYLPRLLDWDKPIQDQAVAGAVAPLMRRRMLELHPWNTGSDIYRELATEAKQRWTKPSANPTEAASDALRSAGIPGVRYLDGVSRGARQGTHNYVIWQPDILRIIGRE